MNEPHFNVIYKNDSYVIPEIDDDELLQFCITFMDILKREIKQSKKNMKNLEESVNC